VCNKISIKPYLALFVLKHEISYFSLFKTNVSHRLIATMSDNLRLATEYLDAVIVNSLLLAAEQPNLLR